MDHLTQDHLRATSRETGYPILTNDLYPQGRKVPLLTYHKIDTDQNINYSIWD